MTHDNMRPDVNPDRPISPVCAALFHLVADGDPGVRSSLHRLVLDPSDGVTAGCSSVSRSPLSSPLCIGSAFGTWAISPSGSRRLGRATSKTPCQRFLPPTTEDIAFALSGQLDRVRRSRSRQHRFRSLYAEGGDDAGGRDHTVHRQRGLRAALSPPAAGRPVPHGSRLDIQPGASPTVRQALDRPSGLTVPC